MALLSKQLTAWLDDAIQNNESRQPRPYDMKLGLALALQSCFPGVIALEVKTLGAHSRGTMTRTEPVVRAGDDLFRVIEQSPWLETYCIERLHTEQLAKLMEYASYQPAGEVDIKTMAISHDAEPVAEAVSAPISPWAQAITSQLQACIQADHLAAVSHSPERPNVGGLHSKAPRL